MYSMKLEKLSSKFIKPLVPTPPNLKHYKIGFIDEFIPFMNVGVVLFFTKSSNHHHHSFVVQLEKSLEKTLTRLYPLAGRYVEANQTIDCNDEGVEFIQAKVNINLEDIVGPKVDVKLVDHFTPYITKTKAIVVRVQLTTFKCGGVALGVSTTHKVVDASTLCTFLNEWAAMNRDVDEIEFTRPARNFNSFSLFPGRGVHPVPLPIIADDMLSKYTTKKLSFNESVISNMRAKAYKSGITSTRYLSKVQLVSSIIWKAFVRVDRAKHDDHLRESILYQPVNLREKMASQIPKYSCGNLFAMFAMKYTTTHETTEGLANLLNASIKKVMNDYSKVHHDSEQGQTMVLNSFLHMASIPESTNVIISTSWCKFPFYQVDFGFGKPVWAVPATMPLRNSAHLIDDIEGNGVEAYIVLEVKDVPYFEKALDVDVFRA